MSSIARESFRCPSCDQPFSNLNQEESRIPLLLQCSHSICRNCVKRQVGGQARCAKCHDLTEYDVDFGLPKNIYLLGLLQDSWGKTKPVFEQCIDETKECQCGKSVTTCCDRCEILICRPCFEKSHADGFWRKHRLIDPGQEKASALIRELKAKASSTLRRTCDNKEMNAKHLPDLQKLKETLAVTLKENLTVFEKFEKHRDAIKEKCAEACCAVDVVIVELIAVLQNVSKERKSELRAALEKYQKQLDQKINKELWVEDTNNLKAAINSIEEIINSDSHDLDYKTFIALLERSVPAVVRELKIPTTDKNPFSIEIDDEMKPSKIKKRIKVYTSLPTDENSATTKQQEWPTLTQSNQLVAKASQKPKVFKSVDPPKLVTKPVEKPKTQLLNGHAAPAQKPVEDSSSSSSCFSDEEDLKKARKAKKKSSSSGTSSVKIIHQNSELSMRSHIDECMLSRDVVTRPKAFSRGSTKPTHTTISNQSKFKFPEQRKFEIPDKPLIQFNYFDAKIVNFVSFDEFYVRHVESEDLAEARKLAKDMKSYFEIAANQRDFTRSAHVSFYGVYKLEDEWQRCLVVKVLPANYEIFLVDLGYQMRIPKGDLKMMPSFLTKYSKLAIKCRLADIKKDHNLSYTEKAVKAFKKLAMSSIGTMSVMVVKENAKKSEAIPVVLHIFPNNGLRVNVNAYLAERFDCVVSCGPESVGTITKDDNVEPKKKLPIHDFSGHVQDASNKVDVEILSIESPGKFYAACKLHEQDLQNQEWTIQQEAALLNSYQLLKGCAKKFWKVGDFCFLNREIDCSDRKWYRGCVTSDSKSPTEQLDVFLIDKGISVQINADQLVDAPNCVKPDRPPAALKMHLAGAIPMGSSGLWNRSSIEMFKKVVQGFSHFCISDTGEKDLEGSLPVTLWGVTLAHDTIITEQREFHDIGAYLANEGYIDRSRPSSSTSAEVAQITKSVDSPHPIDGWLAAAPVTVGEFQGIPTEVDDNGVIYIQSRDQRATFNELKIKLTLKYLDYEVERKPFDLKLGQAVIVHQKVTGEFYRGVVEKIIKKVFKIRLIDTGTVELAERRDIFANVVAAETPILCQKFRLATVVPMNIASGKWPKATLEFIHGEIVDKAVTVTVTEVGDISFCSIRIDEVKFEDIETVLVDEHMARWRRLDDVWPAQNEKSGDEAEPSDAFEHEHLEQMKAKVAEDKLDQIAKALLKPASVDVSPEQTKRYLRAFEEDSNKEVSKSVISLGSRTSSKTSRKAPSEQTTVRTSNAFETINVTKPNSRKRPAVRPPKQIHFFDLQAAEIDQFPCTFASVQSRTKVYLSPQIQELQAKIEELDRALEHLDENMLAKFRHLQEAVNELCLVKINDDWNRAMITDVSGDEKTVDVFLLDSTKTETVDAKFVYKMDYKLQKFPKKTLAVVLDGIKANPRHDDHLIEELVASTLKNRQLKAIVKSHDEKNFPVVELKDESDCLAYQTLIDTKVFTESVL